MRMKSVPATKPDWVPHWKDKSKYPDPKNTSGRVWAWEFLRRNPAYQQLWEKRAALPSKAVHKGDSARAIWEIRERFERDFGVSTPAPPGLTVEDPEFGRVPRFINQTPRYWASPVNLSEDDEFEMPEITFEHETEVIVKFDLRAQIKSQLDAVDRILKTEIKRLTEAGVLRGEPRARLDRYLSYLRLLDAKLIGTTSKTIATEILGIKSDDPDRLKESVRHATRAATQLRDRRYRFLAGWGT
jgi:hypothetical protein